MCMEDEQLPAPSKPAIRGTTTFSLSISPNHGRSPRRPSQVLRSLQALLPSRMGTSGILTRPYSCTAESSQIRPPHRQLHSRFGSTDWLLSNGSSMLPRKPRLGIIPQEMENSSSALQRVLDSMLLLSVEGGISEAISTAIPRKTGLSLSNVSI